MSRTCPGYFSAAAVLRGTALHGTTRLELVPGLPPVRDYIDRVRARPGMRRAEDKDAAFVAQQG